MGLNEDYKKRHKPVAEGKSRYHLGYYIPKLHPEKCISNGLNIYRSSWEYSFYDWCDRNPMIRRWGAEPIGIYYLNPVKNFQKCLKEGMDPNNPYNWVLSTYNIDVWIELQDNKGELHKIFVEIKPHSLTIPPVMPEPGSKPRLFKAYNEAAKTYAVNKAKWDAAKKFCEERGCLFVVVDEIIAKQWGIKFR